MMTLFLNKTHLDMLEIHTYLLINNVVQEIVEASVL